MKKILVSILIIILLQSLSANLSLAGDEAYKGAGTTAATFLKIGVGARATAMGEAFSSVADDATAIYWNPAGLSLFKSKEFSAMHNIYFEDISHDFLGYAQPFGKDKAFGVGLVGVFITGLERFSGSPTTTEPEGTFAAYDGALSLSYSQRIFGNLFGGVSLKGIHQEIDGQCGRGAALDMGLLYKNRIKGLDLGCTIQNIGQEMKIYERSFSLPLTIRAGSSYRLFRDRLTLALDAKKPIDQEVSLHLGTEWWPFRIMALRGGYKYKLDNIEKDPLTGLTAGAGFNFRWLQLEYAYVPYANLGDVHRISLLFRFGRREGEEVGKEEEEVDEEYHTLSTQIFSQENHIIEKDLNPNQEIDGFILFETKESPKKLSYED
ncbi:MAG: PorV/PorQ family protein [bacterium]|nr:PorV/PorQ family protein [bacterium]